MGRHTLKIFGLIICLLVTGLFLRPGRPEARYVKNELQNAEALQVQAITVVPRLAAFGQAKSSRVWAAVAQADSRLIWISPKLISGQSVEKGEDLLHLADESQIPASQAKDAEINIIRAPFNGLITASGLEIGQKTASGITLFTVDATDKAEITIGLNSEKLAMLTDAAPDKPEGNLTSELQSSLSQAWMEVAAAGDNTRLPARLGSRPVSVNPGGLVEASLIVDQPLSPGTMHQVFISGPPKAAQVVIPRQAVHEGGVFVVDGKMRLKKRPVTVKYSLDNYAVIGQGLVPGEILVIGDVAALKTGELTNVRLNDQFYPAAKSDLGSAGQNNRRSNGKLAG